MPRSAPSLASGEIGRDHEAETRGWSRFDDAEESGGSFQIVFADEQFDGTMPPSLERAGIPRRRVFPGAAGIAVLALLVGWAIGRDDGDRVATVDGDQGAVTTQVATALPPVGVSVPGVGAGATSATNRTVQSSGCASAQREPGGLRALPHHAAPPEGQVVGEAGVTADFRLENSLTDSVGVGPELSAIGADSPEFVDEAVLGPNAARARIRSGQRPRAHSRIRRDGQRVHD